MMLLEWIGSGRGQKSRFDKLEDAVVDISCRRSILVVVVVVVEASVVDVQTGVVVCL